VRPPSRAVAAVIFSYSLTGGRSPNADEVSAKEKMNRFPYSSFYCTYRATYSVFAGWILHSLSLSVCMCGYNRGRSKLSIKPTFLCIFFFLVNLSWCAWTLCAVASIRSSNGFVVHIIFHLYLSLLTYCVNLFPLLFLVYLSSLIYSFFFGLLIPNG
jgi:hypothetical protein